MAVTSPVSKSQTPDDFSSVEAWVDSVAALTHPDNVVWCDGTDAENQQLHRPDAVRRHTREPESVGASKSYLHRSDPRDVARTEHLTYICSEKEIDAGPTNNWMAPDRAEEMVKPLFANAMHGRTMYVVPYIMGPEASPYSKIGIEVTDSPYVVANMRIMTRMGQTALDRLRAGGADWVRDSTPSETYPRIGASSCIFPRSDRSGVLALAMAETRC